MATYLQADRLLRVKTPLGPDRLLLRAFSGSEGISQLFRFDLELAAERTESIAIDQLLGQKITAQLRMTSDQFRNFNGICSRMSQGHRDATFLYYRMEVVPELWLLTRVARSRIFQQKTVIQILKEVLQGLTPAPSFKVQGQYESRDYCVQYRETDFNFASRLMEEEGIYYYFEHGDGTHRMVIADTPQSHPDQPFQSEVQFEEAEVGDRLLDSVYSWEKSQELRSGKYTLWDHNFELPGKNLEAEQTIQQNVTVGTVQHQLKIGNNEKLELYDFPGEYAQRFDGIDPGGGDRPSDLQKIFQDNQRTVDLRMEEEASAGLIIQAISHCRAMASGYRFQLKDHFDANGPYVVTTVQHSARIGGDYRSELGEQMNYENSFTCIPAALPFRPQRITPKPVVQGTQTATVVGPAGEEIFTDKYSLVKEQIHWVRGGSNNGQSACWIRVGTIWAGKNWGAIHIPRIDQEVIVAFEEGDPDCPIIVGSVYNPDQMPPYDLPDNKTQSGIMSLSSLQGSPDNYNEIRFEDKKGEEHLLVHAEKDQMIEVENDETHWVGRDRTKTIDRDETTHVKRNRTETVDGNETITIKQNRTEEVTQNEDVTIKQGNRAVTLDMGNDTHQLKMGNRETILDMGNDSHQLKMGNRDVTLDLGNDALTIKLGNQTTKLNLGTSSTEAMMGIELKVGQSSIKVDQMGVTIKGMMVQIEGTIQTSVKGLITQVNGSAMLKAQGGITMIN